MLPLERSSEMGLFRHLSNHLFPVCHFANTKAMRVIYFFEMIKVSTRFQKCSKKFRKIFCCWDNCIWIGFVDLSLLGTGLFPLAANVLTSSPKIWYVNKRDYLHSIALAVISQYDKGAVFCFRDNCIWTGIVVLSVLRTGYFSTTAEVLTSNPKIFHANKWVFFDYNFHASAQWIW